MLRPVLQTVHALCGAPALEKGSALAGSIFQAGLGSKCKKPSNYIPDLGIDEVRVQRTTESSTVQQALGAGKRTTEDEAIYSGFQFRIRLALLR